MDWREQILKGFVPGIGRKTVVADGDDLLREERLYSEVTARGFAVVYYDDPIAFRFAYESDFRQDWDDGGNRELVVVCRPGPGGALELPADILHGARRLSFHLQDVFPHLSYTVVSRLDKAYFDRLFVAHQEYARQPLGDRMTQDFILRHVFEIAPEMIKRDSDLLRLLLRRHYRRLNIPADLDEYLISALENAGRFAPWPLREIVRDGGTFWAFLQERWPLFLASLAAEPGGAVLNAAEEAGLRFPGVFRLPFEHDDVRIYIDNLFVEGILKPVPARAAAVQALPWVKVGMVSEAGGPVPLDVADLCRGLEETCPGPQDSGQAWLAFAARYGQARALRTLESQRFSEDDRSRYDTLAAALNARFASWMLSRYSGLYNYPPVSPVMVHHIPGFLAQRLAADGQSKAAFVLIDGLSLDQWTIVREALRGQVRQFSFEERALLAWVPTITPVSRQAAFAGRIPGTFVDTILRTDRDENGWRQFWSDRGLAPDEIAFIAMHGNPGDEAGIDAVVSHRTRVLGLTVYKVDRIMHGAELGAEGMAGQVRTWAAGPFLIALFGELLDRGFDVWVSSDHGNTEAIGMGAPKDGVLSDKRGERCRVYPDPILRAAAAGAGPGAMCWDHAALPKGFSCLLAPAGRSFTAAGLAVVCHGGISIEEVAVPFVHVTTGRSTAP